MSRQAVLLWLVPLAITGGLLDATAVLNADSFGVGLYVATAALAVSFVLLCLGLDADLRLTVPRFTVTVTLCSLAIIWLMSTLQLGFGIGSAESMLTQCLLRTALIGNFAICLLLFRLPGAAPLLQPALGLFLLPFLLYGLYDFAAQLLGWPRFLDPLRNNASLAISTQSGAQGWIELPRLSSLAAEPSHCIMHLALAFVLAARSRGWFCWLLLLLALAFAVGTFARSVWAVLAAAALAAAGVRLLERWRDVLPRPTVTAALGTAAVLLPFAAAAAPLLIPLPADADPSLAERVDSSRAALQLFFAHPFAGVGFQGWVGRFYQFSTELGGELAPLLFVHNGLAAMLAALGIAGAIIIYGPLLLILGADNLSAPAKAWWLTVFAIVNLGGDYFALASSWTTLAILLSLPPVLDRTAP